MVGSGERFGLSCALATPFRGDGSVDGRLLAAQARWCLAEGCGSVAVFGTTGEGASVDLAARGRALEDLLGARIEPEGQLVGGVAATSVEDAAAQAGMWLEAGCRAILLPPPFYFKGVAEEGLFAWFAGVFERLGGRARDVLLYHIPAVTAVEVTVGLVGRLRRAFPEVVAGVKDSSGDRATADALLAEHADLAILIGDERLLARGVAKGAQGAISGLANVCPGQLGKLVATGRDDARISSVVDAMLEYPVTAAVKALVAHRTGDRAWLRVRPPLSPLSVEDMRRLGAAYDAIFVAEAA